MEIEYETKEKGETKNPTGAYLWTRPLRFHWSTLQGTFFYDSGLIQNKQNPVFVARFPLLRTVPLSFWSGTVLEIKKQRRKTILNSIFVCPCLGDIPENSEYKSFTLSRMPLRIFSLSSSIFWCFSLRRSSCSLISQTKKGKKQNLFF